MTTTVTSAGITFNDSTTLETAGVTWTSTVATTSGSAFDFTSIPSGTQIIYVAFDGVSLSGTGNLLIQLGDSGGLETTGYVSDSDWSGNAVQSTSGFIIRVSDPSRLVSGVYIFTRMSSSTNTWVGGGSPAVGTTVASSGGLKSLSAELDRVRITRTTTNTFTAGTISIGYSK